MYVSLLRCIVTTQSENFFLEKDLVCNGFTLYISTLVYTSTNKHVGEGGRLGAVMRVGQICMIICPWDIEE